MTDEEVIKDTPEETQDEALKAQVKAETELKKRVAQLEGLND